MTFEELQDAVLNERFDESQRGDVKNWINHRYTWLWALEDWTFKRARATVTVTAGSSTVTGLPDDFGREISLRRPNGDKLTYLAPTEFDDAFYDTVSGSTGVPEAYTVENGAIRVGPTSSETSSAYLLTYWRAIVHHDVNGAVVVGLMSADTDEPAFDEGFHFALVHGGSAEGLKLQNDPTYQAFEQDFQGSITAMRRDYLVETRGEAEQWPADPYYQDIDGYRWA